MLNETAAAKLVTNLFGSEQEDFQGTAHYMRNMRPSVKNFDPTVVNATVWIRSLKKVDDVEQTLSYNLVTRYDWLDPFLTWDPAEYDGITQLVLEGYEQVIWYPIFEIWTTVEAPHAGMDFEGLTFLLSSTGLVTLMDERAVLSACPLNVEDFPFDSQSCVTEIGDLITDTRYQIFGSVMLNGKSSEATLSSWNVKDIHVKAEYECFTYAQMSRGATEDATAFALAHTVSPMDQGYLYNGVTCNSFFKITVDLERYYEPYVTMSIIPVSFVTFITFISFQLPVGGGERTGLIITALLTVVAVMFVTAEKLPDTKSTTILDSFNKAMILINLIVMIEAGLVSMLIEYNRYVDTDEYPVIKIIYPELWWTPLMSSMSGNSSKVQDGPPDTSSIEGFNGAAEEKSHRAMLSLEECKALASELDPIDEKSYKEIVRILEKEDNWATLLPKLAAEGLVSVILIEKATPEQLRLLLGVSLGTAIRLQRAAFEATTTDSTILLGDVIDRFCLFTFPVLWLVVLVVILGDKLDLAEVVFGLTASK
ncbi:hypothetical protein CYMTET_17541 [Cymbomonas tetramitiformis]|uniref:Neurotransmitter-gated ion-channel ligand-binding domain-containing protein n=1 Tax=Cymbomonas tetramitiformis TaxID=36881 RepID=A0AAE0G9R3_9CHLO|nr:hypothetical protein CYMTET_17541 [Cymbomonas tetramitiformis]